MSRRARTSGAPLNPILEDNNPEFAIGDKRSKIRSSPRYGRVALLVEPPLRELARQLQTFYSFLSFLFTIHRGECFSLESEPKWSKQMGF
jgi:hypothetical protein